MAVSAEEQAKRSGNVMNTTMAIMISIPLVGDLIGMFAVLPGLVRRILVASENRVNDLLALAGFTVIFFAALGLWLGLKDYLGGTFAFFLMYVCRVAIATYCFSWFSRRLNQT